MKRATATLILLAVMVLTGCQTIAGVGRDLTWASEQITGEEVPE